MTLSPAPTATALLVLLAALAPPARADDAPAALLERGRYLVSITGCNDCHTAGYSASSGKLPASQWFMGNTLGYEGRWGTTYAINLRLYMQELSADEWVAKARTLTARPPMPWFNLRNWNDTDLRALYALVRSLGPGGEPAPAYLPPGEVARGPVVRYP